MFQQWRQWRERQATFRTAMHSCHTTKWRASQSAHSHKSADYKWGTRYRAEYRLQYVGNDGGNVGILQFAPGVSHECSHRNIKNTVCQFVRTYWTSMRLKVTVSWITSSPVMRCGVTTKPEYKWQSMDWRHVNSPSKKELKMLPSVDKVMCTVFWDRKGVILLDFLEPKQKIWPLHRDAKLKAWISRARPEKKTTFLLQHDNARPHTSLKTVEHTVNLGQTVVPHPLYNPDLVPSDFHLFRPMKDELHGQHFPSNDADVRAVKHWATSTGSDFYECGMQALVPSWRKCRANHGDYVEK